MEAMNEETDTSHIQKERRNEPLLMTHLCSFLPLFFAQKSSQNKQTDNDDFLEMMIFLWFPPPLKKRKRK